MEALRLQDGAFVRARYEELQESRRQCEQVQPDRAKDKSASSCTPSRELSAEERQELEQWRIVERAAALDAQGPTPQWRKKFSVLASILESLYAEQGTDPSVTSPSKMALSRPETGDGTSPVPLKELPLPTQVALKMFFRTCQSLRDPAKLTANSRLSVQIASKLPLILTTMPPCVLSPGLVDDTLVDVEDGGNVSSVFYQLFRLFEELLGVGGDEESSTSPRERVCLSVSERAAVIVAYVALALKWGRLAYLLKGVKLLLENGDELNGARFEPLGPLFRELAATSIERPQIAFGEEEQPCGYLMSFGKGDHGKLGHGQCSHVNCQEGNCTENKMVPTMIAATRDVLFRKIDSLSTHSIAITAKGEAMAWGNGDKYRLGHGSSSKEYMPRTIEFLSLKGRARDLACGLGHTLALMESGELYTWGNGSNGRLGLGDTNDRSSPTRVAIPTPSTKQDEEPSESNSASTAPVRFRHIFCGASHSLGLSWDGRAYAWGKNNQGQCGHGHTNDQWTIQEIESFRESEEGEEEECVVYAAGGWEHTLFCTASGRVYSCGCGYKDSRRAGIPPVLGHGDCDRRLKPTMVQALDDAHEEVVKVACGWDHSLAVTANGRVYTWGSGTNGKLGHGDEESFDIPTLVRCMDGKKVKDAKAGCEHTVFLTYDHELWTCGQGDSGRLGHGDSQTRKRPTKIELFAGCGLKPVALAVGDKYNLVLVKDADGHDDHDIDNSAISVQNSVHPVNNDAVSSHGTTNTHHGVHRPAQHRKIHDNQQISFGAKWVMEIGAGQDVKGGPATTKAVTPTKDESLPSSAKGVALFIAGHIDRLASDYIADDSDVQNEKQNESSAIETVAKAQSVLLPFAVDDTSRESLSALLQLLRWTASCSEVKEKAARSERSGSDGSCVPPHVRMGLALSCLRVLQLNLKRSRGLSNQNVGSLFKHIHELLDTLAGQKGEDIANRFDTGARRSGGASSLSAAGSAVSHEAASALKMGFGIFYPTGIARSKLLWGILDDCKIEIPSMRMIILTDQLCKDSVMTEIFKCVPSYGLLPLSETFGGLHAENSQGKDVFEIKTLMIMLLQRCSVAAVKHLEDEAFTDFSREPDCFLRLLHVLQTHYFSIVHQVTHNANKNNNRGSVDPDPAANSAPQRIMDSLLEYVDALMTEALAVLKRLHKASRQHEDIITWRLNGSFFHTLLPSALECLSVLLLPDSKQDKPSENLLLVERVLPNLHIMLKMLDEVSWKMHTAGDGGNQTHDDSASTPAHYLSCKSQERNWFVDLGDACAVLCGKLSCQLFYPSHVSAMDNAQHGAVCAAVMKEGSFLEERHDVVVLTDMASSGSIARILEWERLGVFEVEDELIGSADDPSTSETTVLPKVYENQRFLLQLCETVLPDKPVPFWGWIASSLSHEVQLSVDISRLLTIVVSVSAWHLGLVDELRQVYECYEMSPEVPQQSEATPTGKIGKLFTVAVATIKNSPWLCRRIDSDGIANAIRLSRLLLSLQPNPALVGFTVRSEVNQEDHPEFWDSLEDMINFMTSMDADVLERSFRAREVHAALVRTGVCILHDLLRKLTTSSAKSGLLSEFVSVTCASSPMNSKLNIQRITLNRYSGKHVHKAIENLFVRLARIISSDDASFELRKKALLAWTVPLGTSKQSVVALIAKSGIMSTLIDLLLDDANVLETHSELNAVAQFTNHAGVEAVGDKMSGSTFAAESQPTKGNPVNTLLFDRTPAQIISTLAWEAFCAITWQLTRSERFVQQRSTLFLRAAGSSLQDRDLLTPRSTSMSPRRRLTLPKKMVVSTIDEIIEQLIDGLFLMLKRVKARFEAIEFFSNEYEKLLRSSIDHDGSIESSVQDKKCSARVFLFGRPILLSHTNTQDVRIPKTTQTGKDSDGTSDFTLSFWIYVEHTGAIASKHAADVSSTNSRSKDSCVRLLGFRPDQDTSTGTDPAGSDKPAPLVVFTRDAYSDHVSIGISIRRSENAKDSWSTVLVDEHVQRGNWVNVALGFANDGQDPFRAFVGGKRSTLNDGKRLVDNGELMSPEFLQKAATWSVLTAGGTADIPGLDQGGNDASGLSMLPKKMNHHSFSAVLDDVIISRGVLAEEMAVRMQISGTMLFRLKQQHVVEKHCEKVLQLLCQLVSERNSDQSSPAPLPLSDRWITLFRRMLLSTCQDQDLAQVYLCYLLQDILPRALPLPEFDIQAVAQSLFTTPSSRIKRASVEELFAAFNEKSYLPSTTAARQHEVLYRLMQQHGILHGLSRGKSSSGSTSETVPFKTKLSMRFAAAINLFQKLWSTPSWKSRMDEYIANSSSKLRSFEGPGEAFQSSDKNRSNDTDVYAVVNVIAGYSEEELNLHRASTLDGVTFPSPLQVCSLPFSSVICLENSGNDQVTSIQTLMVAMLREGAQHTLSLPARSDILAKYHNDVVSVDAADRRIGFLLHLRTRVLRVLMTTLLREQNESSVSNSWHHFLLENAVACEDLLRVASSSTREYVATALGPDAKIAMKLRRLRVFSREVLRGSKRHRSLLSAVSITDLESLQWRLWEEMSVSPSCTPLSPWWQQNNDANGKLSLEVVGGDVELSELKVTALEHFPTVKLSQANICANRGLWFFEVVVLTDGLMQIGYVDGDFTADPLQGQGVGDHTNSWAFDGFRCKKWNANSYDYGEQWKTDDVVGVLLDTERMEISYFLNGKFLGVAFSGIPITSSSRMCPAASLNVHQSAQFNFGTLSANDEGPQAPTLDGFKHLPTLDTEDQARLRPIVYVIQSRRPFKSGTGASNVDSQDKTTTNADDLGDDWSSSSSSDNDTDDGGIVVEGSEGPSGFRRHLEPGSRDGRETRTADANGEDAGQRRRDLVEGLTGLGFPLEWATRCATETRLPMDETGAVAWILEQMEKVGLDGASTLPSMVSAATGDGTEYPSHPSTLWRTGAQLPNSVVDNSADGMAAESGSFPGIATSNPADRSDGSDASQMLQVSDNQLSFVSAARPGSSLTERLTTEPAQLNSFIDGDKDDQRSDDESTEAFQSSLYRQHQALHNELQLLGRSDAESTTNETDGKQGVDDLLPLSIAVDTTVFIAYARQAFASLLLLALQETERMAVYAMVRRLVSTDESSLKFYRVLRMAIGLDTMDPTFKVGVVSDTIHSKQSLQLGKAFAALLEYEAQCASDSTAQQSELNPLFKSLSQEIMSQCDRGLNLVRGKVSSKAAADPVAMQAAAAWFAWVSGIVLSFIEAQASAIALAFAPAVCNAAFVENLVSIASSSSRASKPWKYVAFRLISRILSVPHTSEGEKWQLFSSVQLANVTELFTLRCRREMHDRIFFSDVTSCLFTLLVRSTSPCSLVSTSNNPCLLDKSSMKLVVNNYSSTHVTISWEHVSPTALLAASSDEIADATNTEAGAESSPDIMFLDVNRCGPLYAGHSLPTDSEANSTKALPSKGTYTIRNLLPDTTYCIRVGPAQSMDDAVNTATKTGAELIVQTHPAPVFDLDNETMGKNLVALNRNLTAKNTVNKKWHSVRASVAFDEGVHQWQVRLDTCVSKNIFIGVCTAEASMENYIGSDAYGYGFLANKAVWHNKAKLHSYGEIFKQGDIIQVTLDCNAKTLAFSRNGEYLGIAASDMRAGIGRSGANGGGDSNCKWYPAFSMYNKDDKVTLIPPPALSVFSSKGGRPQNASTFELIEAMHDVVAYQSHVTSLKSGGDFAVSKIFEKAYEAFEDWRRGQKIFREISLGQIIAIDNSRAATEKYGLAAGDSVFTSKGQCTVLGEYRHELWYEVDEAGSSSLFGSTTTQPASWSLSVCREMLASPDEYPVHRHHKYKLELDNKTGGETQTVGSAIEQQDWATKTSEEEAFSYLEFVEAQERWGDSGVSAAELDAKLIAELDAIATQQASSSSWALSFADVSTALLLERIYEVHGISAERGSSQTIARIGLLLYVNRCLYNVARLALSRNIYATSLGTPGGSDTLSSERDSGKSLPTMANTECYQVSPVAALLNSPHWGLSDASDFHFISTLAARLLFASQKEKLIGEELRATKTTSRSSENLQESRDNEEGGVDNDLPEVKITYSLSPPTPFWECSSSSRRTSLRLPPSCETSIFVQLATQLAAQDARQWRRESSQPFEAIPISQTFQVRVDKSSYDPSKETASQQQPDEDEDDGDQLQQPSSKQTARYLQLFENVVREVQSPSSPLFAPVESSRTTNRALQDELGSTLQLDVNVELFSSSALAQSRVRIPQLLLWYFSFGQCLGIAWRSKVLLPLKFLSSAFWIELAAPTDRVVEVNGETGDPSAARAAAIRAIRDGLFSIVPSRCVTLMSCNNPSLRDRLSDVDVNYVARLERHATYSGPRQDRHDMFWKVVGAFTSLERRMLEQFINPDRRTDMNQFESGTESPSVFVLEIADALADGRDHPDSCYPVVVQIGPHSSRLHLPAYSSAQTLRHKLLLAMTNIPFM